MKMDKVILLTMIISLLLSGCIRLQYQRSITPGIDRIDGVIFFRGDPENNLLHRPIRILHHNPFIKSNDELKKDEKLVSDKLTDAYTGISLDTIKRDFINIQSPCKEVSITHLKCDYRILGYIDRPPSERDFVKVTLNFYRKEDKTVVSFFGYHCYEGRGPKACREIESERNLVLEVVNYFKKLKPEELVYDLGDIKEYTEVEQ